MSHCRHHVGLSIAGLLVSLLALPPSAGAQEEAPSLEAYSAQRLVDYRLQLDWHPIGPVARKGQLLWGGHIPMHPSGFRADKYSLYFGPTYGLGDGWEVAAAVTGAQRIGRGGEALFYGLGVQKQLMSETRSRPVVSLGAYGMAGPHDHHTGTLYASATKQVWARGERAAFLHGGAKFELYDSDDYGDSTGLRPYAGATLAFSRRLFLSGEFSPSQPWETANPYSVRATYRLHKWIGVSGGIRNNGFETQPFISLAL